MFFILSFDIPMNCRAGAAPASKEQGCVCLCRSNFVHSKNSVGVHCSELPFVLGGKNQAHPWLAAFVSLRPEHWEPCVSGVEPPWGMCGHAPAFQPGQLETAQSPLKLSPLQRKFFSTPHCAFAYWANLEKVMEWCHNSFSLTVNEALMCCITGSISVYMRRPVIFWPKRSYFIFLIEGVLDWCATWICNIFYAFILVVYLVSFDPQKARF